MKVLHVAKFADDKANGIRNVVPYHVIEQAKIQTTFFQNVINVKIPELEQYQLPFEKKGWPYNVKTPDGQTFMPDLVVFHGFYHFEVIALYKRLRKAHIPYILVPHCALTVEAQNNKKLKKIAGNLAFFNRFVRNATAIQCLSQWEYERSAVRPPKFISTNGIYLPERKKERFGGEGVSFVYIGRLDIPQKGLDLLLEAVEKTAAFLRDNRCTISVYGPPVQGSDHVLQDMITEKQISDLVLLKGSVFGAEKEKVLLDADVFLQTSRFEGMPMGVLEAMSYGLPCLVTRGTTLGETVARYEAGWSCETEVNAIAAQLQKAVEERDTYPAKSAAAVRCAESEFCWKTIARNTVAIYQTYADR